MSASRVLRGSVAGLLLVLSIAAQNRYQISEQEKQQVHAKTVELEKILGELRGKRADPALLADIAVYHKAAVWALRYPEEFYRQDYVAKALAALDTGIARARLMAAGSTPWTQQKGRLIRGYRSRIDGSYQPYGLIIPESYGTKPVRLDVVMHGRGATLSEVSFIAAHDGPGGLSEGAFERPAAGLGRVPPGQDFIQLDVFGRVNNGYRWAAETDVFEALASVRQRYNIDPRKIVLRGFSMGGHGAWHIGLHYPDLWAAVEAGAGFTETKVYAKRTDLPPWQEAGLHIYDAVDYALNLFNVPFIGYGGENDAQLRASVNIREQLEKEGFPFTAEPYKWANPNLKALFLVGPGVAHAFHPESRKISEQYIRSILDRPRDKDHIRFVTWTPRYNRSFWVTVDGLEKGYERAEVDAERSDGGRQLSVRTRNVARLTLSDSGLARSIMLDGQQFSNAKSAFEKKDGKWAVGGRAGLRKRHGLQGPIDDAFMDSFLCVRPTGTPANPAVNEAALQVLDVFSKEFPKWMRGDVRVTADTAITKADIFNHHLVLFGDPGSNRILAQIASKLPIRWTRDEIIVGGRKFSAKDHLPVLIYPNPLNPEKYVVINSGHTIHEDDFKGTNALQYPRLGDYAVIQVPGAKVELAGLFDEDWNLF